MTGSPHRAEISIRRLVLFIHRRKGCGYAPNSQPTHHLAGKRRRDWHVESTHSGSIAARRLNPGPSDPKSQRLSMQSIRPRHSNGYRADGMSLSDWGAGRFSRLWRRPVASDPRVGGAPYRRFNIVGEHSPRRAFCIYRSADRGRRGIRSIGSAGDTLASSADTANPGGCADSGPWPIRDAQNWLIADFTTSAGIIRKR